MAAIAPSPRTLRLPSLLLRAAPDERLVAALRRGDEKAFEEIYDRHHRALLGFCRHMLGSREEAEDALQHVFVSAHRHLCTDGGPINLKPWLYTIARNRCLSILRARRDTVALDAAHEPSTDSLEVADEIELREDLKEMLGDLARLPVNQREALVLAELGDLSQREIAATLDVRPDKVKALVFQAREALSGWRQARAASCVEIREQLATLRGSDLRRGPIRRHLALCPACTAFEHEVERQRSAFSLLLPVIPGVALKHSVLSAVFSAGHGTAAAGAGSAVAATAVAGGAAGAGAGASGLAVKALVVAALAVSAGGGGAVAVHELDRSKAADRPAATAPARTPAAAAVEEPVVAPRATGPRHASPATSHGRGAPVKTRRGKSGGNRSASAPGQSKVRGANGRGPKTAVNHGAATTKPKVKPVATPKPAKSRPVSTPRRQAAAKTPVAKGWATPPAPSRVKP